MLGKCLLAIAVVLLVVVGALADVRRRRAMRRLRGSRVQQTKLGPVEYAAVGSGPAVLVLHGGMGGWDQGVMLGVSLLSQEACVDYREALAAGDRHLRERYAVIAPSRVGYLRTPPAAGRTPAEGADMMAALLDALGIGRALVVGVSGGGPTALSSRSGTLRRPRPSCKSRPSRGGTSSPHERSTASAVWYSHKAWPGGWT